MALHKVPLAHKVYFKSFLVYKILMPATDAMRAEIAQQEESLLALKRIADRLDQIPSGEYILIVPSVGPPAAYVGRYQGIMKGTRGWRINLDEAAMITAEDGKYSINSLSEFLTTFEKNYAPVFASAEIKRLPTKEEIQPYVNDYYPSISIVRLDVGINDVATALENNYKLHWKDYSSKIRIPERGQAASA
jgi:hypothetical protein